MFDTLSLNLHRNFVYETEDSIHWIAPMEDQDELWVISEPRHSRSLRYKAMQQSVFTCDSQEERLLGFYVGHVNFEPSYFESEEWDWELYTISILKSRCGIGSTVLRHLTSCADVLQQTLMVNPGVISGKKPISDAVLRQWYRRFGFRTIRGAEFMVRKPVPRR